ncbi:hypothetical protein [Lacrimispora sp.]|uniref:hypothetical protein n=1 Tax=Lacrimispora sp. TaxID=2719234 RepID=UPI003461303A
MGKMRPTKMTLTVLMLSILFSFSVYAGEGLGIIPSKSDDDSRAWKYFNADNTMVKDEWRQVNEHWYYFDNEGVSKQNTWAEIGGKWYYFDHWSRMLHDTTTPDGYYVGTDGAWAQ